LRDVGRLDEFQRNIQQLESHAWILVLRVQPKLNNVSWVCL
jgi:hypothetical protein